MGAAQIGPSLGLRPRTRGPRRSAEPAQIPHDRRALHVLIDMDIVFDLQLGLDRADGRIFSGSSQLIGAFNKRRGRNHARTLRACVASVGRLGDNQVVVAGPFFTGPKTIADLIVKADPTGHPAADASHAKDE